MPQVIDQGGLYDRKKIFYKQILDLIVVAACGPPGGGKSDVTPRLTSKFSTFCFPTLAQDSLLRIFRTIVKGFLNIFPKDVKVCPFRRRFGGRGAAPAPAAAEVTNALSALRKHRHLERPILQNVGR